ncbi:MAG: hypothetical protein AAF368_02860 [Planctomycetota bacterium]
MSGVPSDPQRPSSPAAARVLESRLAQTQKLLALSLGSCMALALLALWLLANGGSVTRAGFDDPALRQEAIAQMMQIGDGYYDSHPDPQVARMLQSGIEGREFYGDLKLTTNSLGLREREFAIPKPEGVTRVVLLGDSFVFGSGLNAEQRFGYALERELQQRAQATGELAPEKIEVLHIGVSSWNALAESAFLRRKLSILQPDLVLHVLVNNDLDDCAGVRGFGGMGRFSPQFPSAGDGMLRRRYAKQDLGVGRVGWLSHALDGESRTRFERARSEILRLREAIQEQGGQYQLMLAWGRLNPIAHAQFSQDLAAEELIYVDPVFGSVVENRVSVDDGHWSESGGAKIASMLYEIIRTRDLLPDFALEGWPDALTQWEQIHASGVTHASREFDLETLLESRPIESELEFTADLIQEDPNGVAQLHGGVDALGFLSPYGSMILRREGTHFELTGRALARPELRGAQIEVFLDEFLVDTIHLEEDVFSHTLSVPVPTELLDRDFVSVRLHASDWVHQGSSGRDCRSFKLDRVAFVDPTASLSGD